MNPDEECRTCGKTLQWHKENNPVHPFNFGQDGATSMFRRGDRDKRSTRQRPQEETQGVEIASMLHDPVVRIALVNKGILTPADLVAAEMQLKEALKTVQKGDQPWSAHAEENSDSSTRIDKMSTEPFGDKESPRL